VDPALPHAHAPCGSRPPTPQAAARRREPRAGGEGVGGTARLRRLRWVQALRQRRRGDRRVADRRWAAGWTAARLTRLSPRASWSLEDERSVGAVHPTRWGPSRQRQCSVVARGLHLWAMAGAGKTRKRGEGRAEAEQEGIYSIQYLINTSSNQS
jgi:hypothetical protein